MESTLEKGVNNRNRCEEKPFDFLSELVDFVQVQVLCPVYSEASMQSKQMEDLRYSRYDPDALIIENKFIVGVRIATGSFGQVRLGKSIQTEEDVIVKMEKLGAHVPTLLQEYKFYNMLGSANGESVFF